MIGRLAKGIRRRMIDLLSLDRMSEKFNILALNYVFLMVYYTLESVFVNTLILRISGDMYAVFLYRGLSYAFCAVAMMLASVFAVKISSVLSIKLAGGIYVLMFVIMFIWMEQLAYLMYPLGVLSGLAMGFYWSGHSVLLTHYTQQQNRAVGLAIIGIIQGFMTLLVPLVSGYVIQLLPGVTGYRVMFAVAIAAVLAQLFYMNKLSPVQQTHKPREFQFAWKLVKKKLTLKIMLASEFTRGFRDGAFLFFLNLVLFEIVDNESLVGINSTLTGVFSILAAWVYGRVAIPARRVRLSVLAVSILLGFCCVLFFMLNAATIMIFSILNAFFAFFLNNAVVNYSFDLFGQNEMMRSYTTELMGFRETAVDLGRIIGLVVLTLFPKSLEGYVWAMITLTASQYGTVILLAVTKRVQERKQLRETKGGL